MDAPTIIHALRMLQTINFVNEDAGRAYYLTVIGKSVVRKLIDCIGETEVLVDHEKFWIEHDISGIPDQLFDRVSALRDSTLVVATELDPFKAYRSLVEFLKRSPTVELIASAWFPESPFRYDEFVLGHTHIEYIATEAVLHRLFEEIDQVRMKKDLGEGHKLYVLRHDPKLVFAVTDHVIVLFLYRLDGGLDHSAALTSESTEALAWGHEMFHHYVDLSESITL